MNPAAKPSASAVGANTPAPVPSGVASVVDSARSSSERKGTISTTASSVTDLKAINLIALQSLLLNRIRDDLTEALCSVDHEKHLCSRQIKQLVSRYIQAVRDLEYLHRLSPQVAFDPKPLLNLPLPPDYNGDGPKMTICGFTCKRPNEFKISIETAAFALVGVITVIMPMFIMVEVPGATVSLCTATGFIMVFTLIMVCFRHFEPRDTVSIIAAYTAVLVTFVGSNTAMESSSMAQEYTSSDFRDITGPRMAATETAAAAMTAAGVGAAEATSFPYWTFGRGN